MRVALTGANGFTGRFVTAALERAGATGVPLDVDLTDAAAVDRAVSVADFDCVIHLAGKAFVDASDWEAFYAVNQFGTFHLLDAIARHRPGVRCVLASSAQVYGPGAQGLITEDAPTNPANHYAVSKLAMEWGARRWDDQLEIVATRPFNYTGVGQGTEYLIPKIVSHFRRGAEVVELGNLWVKRDFGDVRAVAEAYVGLATVAAPPPATLNVATGTLWSIDDMLDILADLSGYRPDIRVNTAFVRENDVEMLGGDATQLHMALPDWRPRDLTDTLAWMLHAAT